MYLKFLRFQNSNLMAQKLFQSISEEDSLIKLDKIRVYFRSLKNQRRIVTTA